MFANPSISVIWDTVVDEFVGEGTPVGLTSLKLRNIKTGEASDFSAEGAFVAIGHSPATSLFQGKLDLDGEGYIKVETGSTRTSIPGVFACGDVQDKIYRQAVTAAGTGGMAALDAERFLDEQAFQARAEPAVAIGRESCRGRGGQHGLIW